MALGSADERDLLLPLNTGISEDPLWESFLRRLLARTGASRIGLAVRMANAHHMPLVQRTVTTDPSLPLPDLQELAEAGLFPYTTLRPNRVYALAELFSLEHTDVRERQSELLRQGEIADARMMRVVAAGEHNAWIVLMHERMDFGAADSALLSALAPHFGVALAALARNETLVLRAGMAEDALALLGVGEVAFDREARVVVADPLARRVLGVHEGERLHLAPRAAQMLVDACHAMPGKPGVRDVIELDEPEGGALLLRPTSGTGMRLPSPAVAIGALRQPVREDRAGRARILARLLGLSLREAALAEAMARGRTIVEAGADLQLTPETARNYSKRIYAKTGASGQADLVRLVLSGLTPLG